MHSISNISSIADQNQTFPKFFECPLMADISLSRYKHKY